MKIEEAENEIFNIWNQWTTEQKDHQDAGMNLYSWLSTNRRDLLDFRCSGDKYQRINGWVLKWRSSTP